MACIVREDLFLDNSQRLKYGLNSHEIVPAQKEGLTGLGSGGIMPGSLPLGCQIWPRTS
jgi:hypothetical protein